jgi:AcrR family transcriptional regulator
MQTAFKKLPPKRRAEILNAAAGVFAEKGYHQASTPEICARAGISNGALYKYFRNKEDVYLSVMHHGIERMTDLFRKSTEGPESFFDAIEVLFDGLRRFTGRHRPYVQIWVDLSSGSMNRFAADMAAEIETEGKKLFRRLIEQGKDRGEIDPSLDTELAAYALDCQMTLFTYSLVSEYHRKRFSAFFEGRLRGPSPKEKIGLVVESARLLVGKTSDPPGDPKTVDNPARKTHRRKENDNQTRSPHPRDRSLVSSVPGAGGVRRRRPGGRDRQDKLAEGGRAAPRFGAELGEEGRIHPRYRSPGVGSE